MNSPGTIGEPVPVKARYESMGQSEPISGIFPGFLRVMVPFSTAPNVQFMAYNYLFLFGDFLGEPLSF